MVACITRLSRGLRKDMERNNLDSRNTRIRDFAPDEDRKVAVSVRLAAPKELWSPHMFVFEVGGDCCATRVFLLVFELDLPQVNVSSS